MKKIDRLYLEDLAFLAQTKMSDENLEGLMTSVEGDTAVREGKAAHYYRFFYWLIYALQPVNALELGTYTGLSACCMASNNKGGQVTSVDITAGALLSECRSNPGVHFLTQDSLEKVKHLGLIDFLFIDTEHDGRRCLKEFNLYDADISLNGLVFFDDIYIDKCMKKFWDSFNPAGYEKFDLPVHGKAGFGVLIKNGEGGR